MLLTICWVLPVCADGIRQWERDTPVITASGDQGLVQPAVVTDGSDGAFVVWHDRRRSNVYIPSNVYLLRLAGDGSKAWPAARQVTTTTTPKYFPSAIASGDGGVIVAWVESRDDGLCFFDYIIHADYLFECDIYAQKFNRAGDRLWTNGGRPVVKAAANQGKSGIALAADGQGGAFVAWEDGRPDCCKVFAQHLDAAGLRLWSPSGIRISPQPSIAFGAMYGPPHAVSDGAGGVLIAWLDNQNSHLTGVAPLNVQRLDAGGNALWGGGGITAALSRYAHFSMVPDGAGGALLGFAVDNDDRTSLRPAVQKVSADGTMPWGAEGVQGAPGSDSAGVPDVVSDGRGGAFAAWVDNTFTRFSQPDADIRAQRVLPDGRIAWSNRGRVIVDLPGAQDNPRIVSDGDRGAFVFWRDCRDTLDRFECPLSANLYGQYIRGNGSFAWAVQGALVSKAAGSQGVVQGFPNRDSSIAATPVPTGGAILAWPDGRLGPCDNSESVTECDVRAQRVADDPDPTVADLSLSVEVRNGPAAGDVIFRMTVTNMGLGTSEGIKVFVPAWTGATLLSQSASGEVIGSSLIFSLGRLDLNRERTVAFTVRRKQAGQVCATGNVYSETLDSTYDNNRVRSCIDIP